MKFSDFTTSLRNARSLTPASLPVGIQVNEDDVFLLKEIKIIYRVEGASRAPHVLLLVPEMFRVPEINAMPCAHLDTAAWHSDASVYYTTNYCPDCGARMFDNIPPLKGTSEKVQ